MHIVTPEEKNFNLRSEQTEPRPAYRVIAVSNVRVGDGDTIATLDLKLGGLLIHDVKVRRGRQGATYINLPRIRVDGKWVDAIEILSPALEDFVRQTVYRAVAEATR